MARNPILEVLGTPELVALILNNLPIHDLLLNAPLVSPTWHQTILTTPALQEALFFRPSLSPKPFKINPFLQDAFPTHFQPCCQYFGVPDLRDLPWGRRPEIFRRKEASWRRMLLWNGGGQEKIRKIKVTSSVQQMSGTYGRMGYLEVPEGLRMGVVWDLTRNACETKDKGQFAMKWKIHLLLGKENNYIETAIVNGVALRRSLFGRLKRLIRGRRIPVQTRYVELENRVDDDGAKEEEEENDVVSIWLSTYTSCEGRDILAPPPKGLGEEFQSEAYEMVEIEYGEVIQIPSSAAFRDRESTIRRVLAEAGFT